jgi:hypothetical protein
MNLIKKIKAAYIQWNDEQNEKQIKKDNLLQLNALMKLVFKDKKTFEAINLMEQFKVKFDQEIAKRGIESAIENNDCEEYLSNKIKANQKVIK